MNIAMRIQWVLLQRGCVYSFNTLKLIIDTFEVEGNAERCLCGIGHLANVCACVRALGGGCHGLSAFATRAIGMRCVEAKYLDTPISRIGTQVTRASGMNTMWNKTTLQLTVRLSTALR